MFQTSAWKGGDFNQKYHDWVGATERERERERQTDRQTDNRQTDRQTEGDTETETERERETIVTERERDYMREIK